MTMSFAEAAEFVFGFTNYEFTPLSAAPAAALDLTRLRSLLARLGDPQRGRRSVHVTGSKGKGSTARMIAALLEQGGARVGLYTSPHLHSPCERIAIDGAPIEESEFAALASTLRPHVEACHAACPSSPLTTFELLTALAFLAFREHGCDWQVVEVGLGGRLDATNVLDEKALCVFTPISLEHTAILGPTTTAIAADKSGILRRGCRAVTAPQDAEAGATLRSSCDALDVPLASVADACVWQATPRALDGQECMVRTPRAEYSFFLPLLGAHQTENAATALLSVENLSDSGAGLKPDTAAEAFASVRWPGRLEVISRRPLLLVDGAHNAASAARLAEALRELLPDATAGAMHRAPTPDVGGLVLMIGTLADKDLPGIVAALAPVAAEAIAVEPDHPRARPAAEIAAAFAAAGVPSRVAGGIVGGIHAALQRAGPAGAICAAGSLYVAAEARAAALGAG